MAVADVAPRVQRVPHRRRRTVATGGRRAGRQRAPRSWRSWPTLFADREHRHRRGARQLLRRRAGPVASARPTRPRARQMISRRQPGLAQRFNDVGDRLQEMRVGTDRAAAPRDRRGQPRRRSEIAQAQRPDRAGARPRPACPTTCSTGATPRSAALNESMRVTVIEQDDGSAQPVPRQRPAAGGGHRSANADGAAPPIRSTRSSVRSASTQRRPAVAGGRATDAIGGGRIGGLLQLPRRATWPTCENRARPAGGRAGRARSTPQHRLGNDAAGAAQAATASAPLTMPRMRRCTQRQPRPPAPASAWPTPCAAAGQRLPASTTTAASTR
ncbi:MAG: hypothetical protein MZW92_54370 [Comamonadaceae bacterium]|nr:hypothetical protein [Comamonadaceae bacterium]